MSELVLLTESGVVLFGDGKGVELGEGVGCEVVVGAVAGDWVGLVRVGCGCGGVSVEC